MQRTLDDIEGRFVVVPPEEGVSLATLGAFIDPVAEPNIWRDDNTTPAWHIGTAQEPDDAGAFANARVFAPIPSGMPVTAAGSRRFVRRPRQDDRSGSGPECLAAATH